MSSPKMNGLLLLRWYKNLFLNTINSGLVFLSHATTPGRFLGHVKLLCTCASHLRAHRSQKLVEVLEENIIRQLYTPLIRFKKSAKKTTPSIRLLMVSCSRLISFLGFSTLLSSIKCAFFDVFLSTILPTQTRKLFWFFQQSKLLNTNILYCKNSLSTTPFYCYNLLLLNLLIKQKLFRTSRMFRIDVLTTTR